MSLYDDAAVALIAEGAAGRDNVLYNIKPEESLKTAERVANGDFNDGANDWTVSGSDVSITGGKIVFAGSDNFETVTTASSSIFEIGKTYKVSFQVRNFKSETGAKLLVQEAPNVSPSIHSQLPDGEVVKDGNYSVVFTAVGNNGSNSGLVFKAHNGGDLYCEVDNVSVKEVEQAPLDFTFTRGSNLTATRVGPGGLIEKGRENLIRYSNNLTNSLWGISDVVYNDIVAGQQGYDGSNNAFLIDKITNANSYVGVPVLTYDGVFTWSGYFKNEGTDDNSVYMFTPIVSQYFDLVNGQKIGGPAGASPISSSMESIGNGWYRCSVTGFGSISSGVPNDRPRFKVANLDGSDPGTGAYNDTGKIFVQDFQFEVGLVATDYIDRPGTLTGTAGILENEPRFDYTEVTCPHLLMEPTRKNMHKYSEYRPSNSFFNSTGLLGFESPEGFNNAYKISADSSNDSHFVVNGMITGLTSDAKHTASVFVKAGTNINHVKFGITDQSASTNFAYAYFGITGDGTVGATHEGGTGTLHRKTIEKIGTSGWYRVSVTATVTHDNTVGLKSVLFMSNDGSDPVLFQDNTAFFFAYGWQFEARSGFAAAYATSYIPNHGTAAGVTRNQDETNATDLSDYMDGKDITMLVDLAKNPLLDRDSASTGIRLGKSNHHFSAFRFYRPGLNKRTSVYFADRDNDPNPVSHQITTAGRVKVVVRRVESTGEFTIFYAGDQKYQSFNTDYDDFANLQIKANGQPIFINSIIIFDRALTDDEAKSLTTV